MKHGVAIPRKWDDDKVSWDETWQDSDRTIFVGRDVKGDGNCLLRCLAESGLLPSHYTHETIRQALLETAKEEVEFGKLAHERSFDTREYHTYLNESLAVDGEWTGDFEMLLFLKTFGINVVSFTQTPFGLVCFNANDYVVEAMHLKPMNTSAESIYVLHHEYGNPLQVTEEGNHFCLLFPVRGELHPLTGVLIDPSRAYEPILSREALPHDSTKFVGQGTSANPLSEVDNDNDDVVSVESRDSVKRKAPSGELVLMEYDPPTKRMPMTSCTRELRTMLLQQRLPLSLREYYSISY